MPGLALCRRSDGALLVSDFEYVELAPSPELAPLVNRLWYLRTPSALRFERILPMPFVHVIVNLGEPYRVVRRGAESVNKTVRGAFVSGLQSTYLVNENPQLIEHVGAELQPYALHALSQMPPAQVTDTVQEVDAVLPGLDRLREAIGPSPLPVEAVTRLDSELRRRLRAQPPHPAVVTAVSLIAANPDQLIGDIARQCGVSHKTLIGQFKRHCGVTPKAYADVCRFHRFLGALPRSGAMPSWTTLLSQAGYYDQPHFIRSFARFTGLTPRAYYAALGEHGAQFPSFLAQAEG